MKILVDTNVVTDYITMREPFYKKAYEVMMLCADKKVECAIAAHTIPTIYYILRKEMDDQARRNVIKSFLTIFDVVSFSKEMVLDALERENFKDFEDCLQDECAVSVSADYIVTRNVKDFANGKVTALTPEDFLQEYQKAGTQP